MLTRVLSVGLLAGLLAGLAIALLQQATTTPLILAAETYEKPSGTQPAAAESKAHQHEDHAAHDDGWKPENGLPRFFYTSVATVATAGGGSFFFSPGLPFARGPVDGRRSPAWSLS